MQILLNFKYNFILYNFIRNGFYLGYTVNQRHPINNIWLIGSRFKIDLINFSYFCIFFHKNIELLQYVCKRFSIIWLLFTTSNIINFILQKIQKKNTNFLILYFIKFKVKLYRGFFSNSYIFYKKWQLLKLIGWPSMFFALHGTFLSSLAREANRCGILSIVIHDTNQKLNNSYVFLMNEKIIKSQLFILKLVWHIFLYTKTYKNITFLKKLY